MCVIKLMWLWVKSICRLIFTTPYLPRLHSKALWWQCMCSVFLKTHLPQDLMTSCLLKLVLLLLIGFCGNEMNNIYKALNTIHGSYDVTIINIFFRVIYVKGRVLERQEREETVCHALVHFLNSRNGQNWARSKPGARSIFQMSHMGGRATSTWALFCCFPRCFSKELDYRWNNQDMNCMLVLQVVASCAVPHWWYHYYSY